MTPRTSDVPQVSVTHRHMRPAVTFPADALYVAIAELDQYVDGYGTVGARLADRYAALTLGEVEVKVVGEPVALAGSLVTA